MQWLSYITRFNIYKSYYTIIKFVLLISNNIVWNKPCKVGILSHLVASCVQVVMKFAMILSISVLQNKLYLFLNLTSVF